MSTEWTYPSVVTQSPEVDVESHIAWDSNNLSSFYKDYGITLETLKPLYHIANSYTGARNSKTWYLYFTGFNFSEIPTDITGIELSVMSNRAGRVTDDTIQLISDDIMIGENRANADLSPHKIYGSPTDTWGIDINDINSIVTGTTFGVCLRFQSHPFYPHRDAPMLNQVKIRLITGSTE